MTVDKNALGQRGQAQCCCLLQGLGGKSCLFKGLGGSQEGRLNVLRRFRDEVLKKHRSGVLFVRAYYGFSALSVPPLQRHRVAGGCAAPVVASLVKPLAALSAFVMEGTTAAGRPARP
jgi:hypothetical protein